MSNDKRSARQHKVNIRKINKLTEDISELLTVSRHLENELQTAWSTLSSLISDKYNYSLEEIVDEVTQKLYLNALETLSNFKKIPLYQMLNHGNFNKLIEDLEWSVTIPVKATDGDYNTTGFYYFDNTTGFEYTTDPIKAQNNYNHILVEVKTDEEAEDGQKTFQKTLKIAMR